MLKKVLLIGTISTILSAPVLANWQVGAGYLNVADDSSGSVDLHGVVASAGYRFEFNPNFVVQPELLVGTGVGDDSSYGIKIELDRYVALKLKLQGEFDNGLYVHISPSYADVEVEVSYMSYGGSGSESSVGIGLGAGYQSKSGWGVEANYDTYSEDLQVDVISILAKYKF